MDFYYYYYCVVDGMTFIFLGFVFLDCCSFSEHLLGKTQHLLGLLQSSLCAP